MQKICEYAEKLIFSIHVLGVIANNFDPMTARGKLSCAKTYQAVKLRHVV